MNSPYMWYLTLDITYLLLNGRGGGNLVFALAVELQIYVFHHR